MKPVAIYARVSSERQKEQETIASQTEALLEHAVQQNWAVPLEWRFLDEGYSGASLVRPGLDSLRDRVAEGQIDTVVVLSPDPAEPEVCLPDTTNRRVTSARS